MSLKDFYQRIASEIQEPQTRFRLSILGGVLVVPILTVIVFGSLMWIFLKMNMAFLHSLGVTPRGYSYYLDGVLSSIAPYIPYLSFFLIILIFVSFYISYLLVRPFKVIASYCEEFVQKKQVEYNSDFLTDLKLMTVFSEFFFNYIETSKINGFMGKTVIPKKFKSIHAPIFEFSFFLHYSIFLIVSAAVVSIGLYGVTNEIHEKMLEIFLKVVTLAPGNNYFDVQKEILESISYLVILFYMMSYVVLSFFLYRQVSIPSFAVFSTMRAFISGKHETRVHLLGHYFLRDYCRKLNALLSYMKNNFPNKNSDGQGFTQIEGNEDE